MKKKIRVRFDSLKRGDCFRLTVKGPIYMKDIHDGGQVILGRSLGRVYLPDRNPLVYPTTVKIVEEK